MKKNWILLVGELELSLLSLALKFLKGYWEAWKHWRFQYSIVQININPTQ